MKMFWKKFLIYLLVFLVSAALTAFSVVVNIGIVGLPENITFLTIFISIAPITFFSLRSTKNLLSAKSILFTILLAWFALFLPKALSSSFNFTLTNIPFLISFLMAMVAGYMYFKQRSWQMPILIFIFPLILTLGLGALLNNKIVYGSTDGEVQSRIAPDFNIVDKEGSVINNKSIKGKIVLMDFWFISCPPCWVKFPELQKFYDQYKSYDQIAIYAVNRPMKTDKPNQLYTSIEHKDFTFPVAKGTEEMMTSFGIDYYPTVIILDSNGYVVYKGGIENVKKVVENLL